MEKVILETIIAFPNTRGGTLLIGVADNGTIIGIDDSSFEGSRDKFTLHLNHLIEKDTSTFFIHSGPSSIDLHGMDMLYYANRNFGTRLKRLREPVKK